MSDTQLKIYFGDRAATKEELGYVEEIVVDQEIDAIWQATMKVSLCIDEKGHWRHQASEFGEPFSRIRVEIKTGNQPSTALIDGPIASVDSKLDSQPGRSTVSLVVRDDSVKLNREDRTITYSPPKTDEQIVREVFERHTDVIGETDVVTPPDDAPREVFQRASDYVFLRQLAVAHHFHAYVLPGQTRGKSKGCFRSFPDSTSTDHPPLILTGPNRNLMAASVSDDSEGPERTRSRTLQTSDVQIQTVDTTYDDLHFIRDFPAVPEDAAAIRYVPPQKQDRDDPGARAHAQQSSRSYSIRLQAHVIPCYPAVLMPYIRVPVQAGNLGYSGDWVIRKVTHRITPSVYAQELAAVTDSVSRTDGQATAGTGGFGLSLSFSASISIF
jgi:hypothetical protein